MMQVDKEMIALIGAIKTDIYSTRTRLLINANQELISLYFRIGKIVSENSKYGSNFINTLSSSLKLEFPNTEGFSPRNISRMKKFYETYKDLTKLPTALAKLPWSHNCLLIDKVPEISKRSWYAEKCFENGWSFVVLDHQIDLKLYERQADNSKKLNNFPGFVCYNLKIPKIILRKDKKRTKKKNSVLEKLKKFFSKYFGLGIYNIELFSGW